MTREEEIKKQADIYTDNASNYAEWSDDGGWSETNDIELIEKAFEEGAKWADEHPCMSEEEQVGMGGLGMIWKKKHLINKAIDILIDLANDGCLIDIHNHEEFEKQFRKIMEE